MVPSSSQEESLEEMAPLLDLPSGSRAPTDPERVGFRALDSFFAQFNGHSVTNEGNGRVVPLMPTRMISYGLNHGGYQKCRQLQPLQQFATLAYDQVHGKGSCDNLFKYDKENDAQEKGCIMGILKAFRCYTREPDYKGPFAPLSKQEADAAKAEMELFRSEKKETILSKSEVQVLQKLVHFMALVDGKTLLEYCNYFRTKYFYEDGESGNPRFGILVWNLGLLFGRGSGQFGEYIAGRIAVTFRDISVGIRTHDVVDFGSLTFSKRVYQAAQVEGFPTEKIQDCLSGKDKGPLFWRKVWVYLVENGFYTKEWSIFNKTVKQWFHPLHSRNTKCTKPWGPADDNLLEIILTYLSTQDADMHAVSVAALMLASRTINEEGEAVMPVKDAQPRPYNYLQRRLAAKFGHYALLLRKLNIAFEKVLSAASIKKLTKLGITNDTPLAKAKDIIKRDSPESLELDVAKDSIDDDLDDEAHSDAPAPPRKRKGSTIKKSDKTKKAKKS